MGATKTALALTIMTLIGNMSVFGWWGILTSALLLTLPYYLIYFDSRKPFDQQFNYANSRWGKRWPKQ